MVSLGYAWRRIFSAFFMCPSRSSVCPIKRSAQAGMDFSCAVLYCFEDMTFKMSRLSTPKSRYSASRSAWAWAVA